MCISFTMHFDITKSLMVAANRFTTWYTEEAISVIVNCYSLAQEGLYSTRYFAAPSYFRPIFSAGSFWSVSESEFKSSIEKSPPLFAMFIRLRSLSRAELTKTTGNLDMEDAWELGLSSQSLLPFQNDGNPVVCYKESVHSILCSQANVYLAQFKKKIKTMT